MLNWVVPVGIILFAAAFYWVLPYLHVWQIVRSLNDEDYTSLKYVMDALKQLESPWPAEFYLVPRTLGAESDHLELVVAYSKYAGGQIDGECVIEVQKLSLSPVVVGWAPYLHATSLDVYGGYDYAVELKLYGCRPVHILPVQKPDSDLRSVRKEEELLGSIRLRPRLFSRYRGRR